MRGSNSSSETALCFEMQCRVLKPPVAYCAIERGLTWLLPHSNPNDLSDESDCASDLLPSLQSYVLYVIRMWFAVGKCWLCCSSYRYRTST